MDFGALQCTPQSPDCAVCPLMESCVAFRTNRISGLPVKLKTLKVRERHLIYIYVRCQGYVAIHRRGARDIWQGLWEPLCLEENEMHDASGILSSLTSYLLPLRKNVKHVLTHRILLADFYLLETDERPTLPDDYIWVKEEELETYAVPRLVERLYTILRN